jgi:hypothetical protein
VTVPPNTAARVYMPAADASQTFAASGNAEIHYVGFHDGAQI